MPFFRYDCFSRVLSFFGNQCFSEVSVFGEMSCFQKWVVFEKSPCAVSGLKKWGVLGLILGNFRWTSCQEWASELFVGPTDWLDDRDEEWYGVRVFFVTVYCYAELS